jgi:hypothetical protein
VSTRSLVLAGWVVVGLLSLATGIVAYLRRGRLPTLGTLVGAIGRRRVGRVALFAGWLWLGWHAFAR